jgi:hypothetical protein
MARKFELGALVATHGARNLYEGRPEADVRALVLRHQSGDWGDVCDQDAKANDHAVTHDERLLSSYELGGEKVWVITEWDRSVTTILLPAEY